MRRLSCFRTATPQSQNRKCTSACRSASRLQSPYFTQCRCSSLHITWQSSSARILTSRGTLPSPSPWNRIINRAAVLPAGDSNGLPQEVRFLQVRRQQLVLIRLGHECRGNIRLSPLQHVQRHHTRLSILASFSAIPAIGAICTSNQRADNNAEPGAAGQGNKRERGAGSKGPVQVLGEHLNTLLTTITTRYY